jgi:hypothetical protein
VDLLREKRLGSDAGVVGGGSAAEDELGEVGSAAGVEVAGDAKETGPRLIDAVLGRGISEGGVTSPRGWDVFTADEQERTRIVADNFRQGGVRAPRPHGQSRRAKGVYLRGELSRYSPERSRARRDSIRLLISTPTLPSFNFQHPTFNFCIPSTPNFCFSPPPCVIPRTAAMRNQKKNWLLA